MIIKVVYKKEIHLLKLENPVLEQIKKDIQKLYPQINKSYCLFYKDEEGDQISISSDEDLKVLIESVKNQTIKITIETQNIWTCKYCTFENQEGVICEVCCQYKENEPQQQQLVQQYQECRQPVFDIPQPQCYGDPQQYVNYVQQPQAPQIIPPPPPLGSINPQIHPHQEQFKHDPELGGFHRFRQNWKNLHKTNHMKLKRFEQIMRDPQLKQQKEQLQQLLKEISKSIKNRNQNQQYQQQYNWSDMDEQRAKRLAEVLQCNLEWARQYQMIFRDLTFDEIVMQIQNAE
ncbi:unnamed protein product [Paramecium sonneborni]|uniref:PB1 domain-containing protein n=1 Tax=Paramecium sonneborni TaxID=65129 RepID=A0A8S1QE78_9CILI|nr:unnamed protein product [Paramecium sonneborni]